ncbi:MAG: glucose-6-phosphate dehydrogenase [Gammaproteobacteria bacterium]|nr:glucose-6-phosphate dehydrogenase [Gammaproteobacteria bacterium]NNF61856.1 glucose-6-phosphate dehydrogenase [Gammaproteobacteria bacterium]
MVIFGATGDLAMRKLLKALYYRCRDGELPAGRILGASRSELDRDGFIGMVEAAAERFIPAADRAGPEWREFLERIDYFTIDAFKKDTYAGLAEKLAEYPDRVRIYYLSTGSRIFAPICETLRDGGLITDQSRVVLEKPLGHDLESARAINEQVLTCFDESQVFRIDHYLGKEPVQNLMVLRFGNTMFESLWHSTYVDHIQITVAENIGVGTRAGTYDNTGALRDMVQSHLLQLLCIIAMEPPPSIEPNVVRDEKLKVIRSLRPITGRDVDKYVIRGQYQAGAVDGQPVPSYVDEVDVDDASTTETFVAMKAYIDNWRWAKVPFYLRTGKRLERQVSKIVVQFKDVPHSIFGATDIPANKLTIRLQPKEEIRLQLSGKRIGTGMDVRDLSLHLDEDQRGVDHVPDAYERLLLDAVRGRATLFVRRDELEAAWEWVEPITDRWRKQGRSPERYVASTWGPTEAASLLARDGREWDAGSR